MTEKVATTPDLLFETSWEVCNKIGGIYAVLSTKAKTLQAQLKDKVIFVGPDFWTKENESPFFKESKSLLSAWKKEAELPSEIKVRVGRWQVPGKPIAVLVDFKGMFKYKDQLYSTIWEQYGVDSLHAYGDYDESCIFSYSAALVIESIAKFYSKECKNIVAHFDEWTTGMGLLSLKSRCPEIATVFTTHATSIGRSICGNGKPLYDYLKGYNGDQMAQELNMQSKHSLEKTAATQADSFTTVSEVTARECEQLLEVSPMITPNGFESNFVPKGAQFEKDRQEARERMLNVANALLGEELPSDTLFVAVSGRHEFRNKGLDAFIDAVNVLRHDMPRNLKRQIVAFIMVPGWINSHRIDLESAVKSANVNETLPNPIVTHNLNNYNSDSVIGKIHYLGLNNERNESVKIIYVPSYLNGDDGIFNLPYYQLISGLDLTVFPSYYEPWGYTPMESIAFGVPTITTNLSGFGQWVLATYGDNDLKSGVCVVPRCDSNYSQVVLSIAQEVKNIYNSDEKKRKKLSQAAMQTAKSASWDNFIKYYNETYQVALENRNNRIEK